MAIKPTTDDLIGWLQLQSTPTEAQRAVYEEVMETAIDEVESRVKLPDGTDDTHYPQRLRMAEILLAARLMKRGTSPEGVAGMTDLGAVVHILGNDPDIERMVRRFLKSDGFA